MKPRHLRIRDVQSLDLSQIVGMAIQFKVGTRKPNLVVGTILPTDDNQLGIWLSKPSRAQLIGKIVDYEIKNYQLLDWSINIQKRLNNQIAYWHLFGGRHLLEAHKLIWRAAFKPNSGLEFVLTVETAKDLKLIQIAQIVCFDPNWGIKGKVEF